MAKSTPPSTGKKAQEKSASDTARGAEPLLIEVAWEVCNQVGGIYTVLRSKVPSMMSRWRSVMESLKSTT